MTDLLTDAEALEFFTIPARCSGTQDMSRLVELQLMSVDDGTLRGMLGAMAFEGMLRQASVQS